MRGSERGGALRVAGARVQGREGRAPTAVALIGRFDEDVEQNAAEAAGDGSRVQPALRLWLPAGPWQFSQYGQPTGRQGALHSALLHQRVPVVVRVGERLRGADREEDAELRG